MRNAFISLRRNSFLSEARARTPLKSSVVGLLLSNQKKLWWGGACLRYRHPAGRPNWTCPLCYIGWWRSPRCPVWIQCVVFGYTTLGDSPERVYDDFVVLLKRLRAISLEINGSKCQLTILNDSMPEATEVLFRGLLLGVRVVEACDISLLGAPVDIQGIPGTMHVKKELLEKMTS